MAQRRKKDQEEHDIVEDEEENRVKSPPPPTSKRLRFRSEPEEIPPYAVSKADELLLVLCKTPVEDVVVSPPKGDAFWKGIVTVHRDEKLKDAFKKLVKNNILSAPVLSKGHKYYGFVDVFDLTHYMTDLFSGSVTTQEDIHELFEKEGIFRETTIKDVMVYPVSKRNPFHPVLAGFSLFHAFEIMAKTGAHRVPVIDSKERIVNIITQSMLISFLAKHLETFAETADATVDDVLKRIPQKLLVTAHDTAQARAGFAKLAKHNINGLAVVDEKTGHLVDALSVRDLRGIGTDASSFWRLWDTIKNFKKKVRNLYPETPSVPISVISSDTISTVINIMVAHKVHRVFVVQSKENPVPHNVITQGDILHYVLKKALVRSKEEGKEAAEQSEQS